jgi:hypothetical protein
MHTLKLICLTIVQLVNQAWLLPQSAAAAFTQRRRQIARNELVELFSVYGNVVVVTQSDPFPILSQR